MGCLEGNLRVMLGRDYRSTKRELVKLGARAWRKEDERGLLQRAKAQFRDNKKRWRMRYNRARKNLKFINFNQRVFPLDMRNIIFDCELWGCWRIAWKIERCLIRAISASENSDASRVPTEHSLTSLALSFLHFSLTKRYSLIYFNLWTDGIFRISFLLVFSFNSASACNSFRISLACFISFLW